MTDNFDLHYLNIQDIDLCVNVHIKSFQKFFLTFLGRQFLNVLYTSITTDPTGIGWVIKADKKVEGFVIGTSQPGGLYGRLIKRNWWRFGWAALPAFIRKPSILPRLLRAFTMPGQPLPAENCGTLMSIAVDPAAQGSGMGKELVQAFLREAKNRGLDFVNLTTDASGNDATNAFYVSKGFKLHYSFTTPEGRLMNEYLFNLQAFENPEK